MARYAILYWISDTVMLGEAAAEWSARHSGEPVGVSLSPHRNMLGIFQTIVKWWNPS